MTKSAEVVPGIHSAGYPPGFNPTGVRMTRKPDLLDLENDIKASREMADAIYELTEQAVLKGASERDLNALLRCVCVLQEFTSSALETWQRAHEARRAA